MTIMQAITAAQALTGQVYDQATMLRWLSELDGQLAFDVWGRRGWLPYRAEDAALTLAVPYPWDGSVYAHWLEAMTYFSNGEYDRYANARGLFNDALSTFKKTVQRTRTPCGQATILPAGNGGSPEPEEP